MRSKSKKTSPLTTRYFAYLYDNADEFHWQKREYRLDEAKDNQAPYIISEVNGRVLTKQDPYYRLTQFGSICPHETLEAALAQVKDDINKLWSNHIDMLEKELAKARNQQAKKVQSFNRAVGSLETIMLQLKP